MSQTHDPQSFSADAIVIIGIGLIGGSIAAALKKRGFTGRILGVGRNPSRLEAARQAGLIDEGTTDLTAAAARGSLLIFCTPVDLIIDGVLTAAKSCHDGTLITDAGSVKGGICQALAGKLPQRVTFIGSHPLAGSEKQGFEHADADLFDGRFCVVTPYQTTASDQMTRLRDFWQSLGCTVVELSAAEHDQALAQTSHVPHVVAAALASTVSASNRDLTATGFRDTTRIASGDPALWAAIMLSNADEIVGGLGRFSNRLKDFHNAISNQDATTLKNLLQHAKTNRDLLPDYEDR